jgi:DNA-directed RNA polymerase specialized sigma24 family protein
MSRKKRFRDTIRINKRREKYWSPENTEALKALAAQGLSPKAIATKLGFGRYAVAGKCSRDGIRLVTDRSKRTPEKVAEVHRLLQENKNYAEIGAIIGVHQTTVAVWASHEFHERRNARRRKANRQDAQVQSWGDPFSPRNLVSVAFVRCLAGKDGGTFLMVRP